MPTVSVLVLIVEIYKLLFINTSYLSTEPDEAPHHRLCRSLHSVNTCIEPGTDGGFSVTFVPTFGLESGTDMVLVSIAELTTSGPAAQTRLRVWSCCPVLVCSNTWPLGIVLAAGDHAVQL